MEYELADFDLKRLIGQQLTSVWVATNTISLYFLKYPLSKTSKPKDSVTIRINHGYEITIGSALAIFRLEDSIEQFRNGAGAILSLIEHRVCSAISSPEGDIDLNFVKGQSLRILYGDDGFEGFHLFADEK